jgi:hypothetical protein
MKDPEDSADLSRLMNWKSELKKPMNPIFIPTPLKNYL